MTNLLTCFLRPLVETRQLYVVGPAIHGNFIQPAVEVVQELSHEARRSLDEVPGILFRVDGVDRLDGLIMKTVGLVNA